ncbi:MAG: dihydrolipoyl dehydrogenase [Bradymonadaceae bacterium]
MYDLVVIGSGPGGYIAAIRAAQLGMDVACVEKYSTFGGTCLNVGCIPSKALLESSHKFEEAQSDFSEHGIQFEGLDLDLDAMMGHKSEVVDSLVKGVGFLFEKNGVDGIHGHATIRDPNTVEVDGEDGTRTLETERIVVATGSKPDALPGVEYDDEYIVDSTGALAFDEVPDRLVVVGGGYIGLEMGSVWNRLGSDVTVLEFLPRILSGMMDADIAKKARTLFDKQGLDFELESEVTGAEVDGGAGEVTVTYSDRTAEDGSEQSIVADRVLVAIGRHPYTEGLGLEEVGVETDDRGFIPVDEDYETNVDGIHAIGDVVPGPMLAHKAEDEGVVCVERMNGIASHINYDAIPGVVYTHPELAAVGRSEDELEESGVDYNKGRFDFQANGRARALADTDGFAKVLAHAETDQILGAQIIGPQAGDLIAELAVGMEFHGSSEDIARSSHAHPTLSEVVKEAALDVTGDPLNA